MGNPILGQNGEPLEPTRDMGMDSILFRWIMLLLLGISAKVLNKDEVMNIYRLVNESIGHSPIVDGFHSELIRLMDMNKKTEE